VNIVTTSITKHELIELDEYHLDPVTLILEDMGPRQGKLTISCYGEAWTAYWGGMGERPLIDFLLLSNTSYIVDKLFTGQRYEPDFDSFCKREAHELLRMRRAGELTKQEAARLWDRLRDQGSVDDYCLIDNEVASRVIGDDWHAAVDSVATHKYQYLHRIVDAVLDALKQIQGGAA
jgi:hypothetical protein